jgi:hypothetical protein
MGSDKRGRLLHLKINKKIKNGYNIQKIGYNQGQGVASNTK